MTKNQIETLAEVSTRNTWEALPPAQRPDYPLWVIPKTVALSVRDFLSDKGYAGRPQYFLDQDLLEYPIDAAPQTCLLDYIDVLIYEVAYAAAYKAQSGLRKKEGLV